LIGAIVLLGSLCSDQHCKCHKHLCL